MIRIIRREEEPKPVLMKRFKLSDEQTEEILNTRLRHLAKLEEMKIREEQKALATEREELEALLKSKAKLRKLIAAEIRADADKYGDERRTKIIEREAAQAIDETGPHSRTSRSRWCCRPAASCAPPRAMTSSRVQLSYKGGDAFQALARGRSLAAGGVHRQHRTHLHAAGALAAPLRAATASRFPDGSTRPTAPSSPAS